ncbi:hypothetical protein EST92_17320 [Streptomyces sp. TM32]|uniref:hypothetical protein n=1 Tax=Streptomyces sp. TM32 TaxID=1652669 RepID=UPI001013A10D|nr:hypothetical protein [Streptomyces sp. TM32]RXS80543.1 hypothetical protein EST92_17320 [Streptomyces sp. TM32]
MLQNSPSGFRHTNISAAIREIAPTAVLVRVYPERRSVTHLFESDFYRMLIDRRSEERVAQVIRRGFGNTADWRLAHDYYLPTGTLYLTPEPHQNGYIPEDDQCFGLALARRIATADGSY